MIRLFFLPAWTAGFSLLILRCHAFQTRLTSSSYHCPVLEKRTQLASNIDGDGGVTSGLGLPFFASVAASTASEPGVATVTTRLPLGTLFDSRDYIFCTATNVRGYEWTSKETGQLFDDLCDVAVPSASSPNPQSRGDYELSQIVLVPMEWDRTALGIGNRYDVHDGQQRLVTLCLLLAALRESFREKGESDGTVEELTAMLNPPKARKDPVLRIELRKRDNDILRRILLPDLNEKRKLNLPTTVKDRKNLSLTNRRVLDNFELLLSSVTELSKDARLILLDFMLERVYLLVCVPETAMIARNIVLAQGKGMDNEPIDDFKGLVCFRYTRSEDDMYTTFDAWDDLATPPEDTETSKSVGRDMIAAACLLRATATMRNKIIKNDQVYALERWLRHDLVKNNYEGKHFFKRHVKPASLALKRFRDGDYDNFKWASKASDGLREKLVMRLRFLRRLTGGVGCTKELEFVILELLIRAGGAEGHKSLSLWRLDEYLHSIELAALWMIVETPSTAQRYKRCFDMLDAIDTDLLIDDIPEEEKSALLDGLSKREFGSTAGGRKIASAILERLNEYILTENNLDMMPDECLVQIEHVLPPKAGGKYWKEHWANSEENNELSHRLGNLVLLSHKIGARETRKGFDEKRARYEEEVWPLTRSLAKLDTWEKDELLEQQQVNEGLIKKAWGL